MLAVRAPRAWISQIKVHAFTGVPLIAGGLSVAVALLSGLLLDMSSLKRGWADPFNGLFAVEGDRRVVRT